MNAKINESLRAGLRKRMETFGWRKFIWDKAQICMGGSDGWGRFFGHIQQKLHFSPTKH